MSTISLLDRKIAFRALKYQNYRLFYFSYGLSLIGTWMQRTAIVWLVYRMTNSAQILGIIEFTGQIAGVVLIPIAGVLLDSWNRYRVVLWTQMLSMMQALLLAWLVLSGTIQMWHILVLSIFLGIINSFEMPARQAFISQIVAERKDLSNAIALNSFLFNGARIIGPTIAGLTIALYGEGFCFFINGLSYLTMLGALLRMKLNGEPALAKKPGKIFEGIKEGCTYTYQSVPIRFVLLLLMVVSLVGMPIVPLMAVFVNEVLGGGSELLGWLMAAFGSGALVGTICLATRRSIVGIEKVIAITCMIFGLGLITLSISNTLWVSLVISFIMGFGVFAQVASTNTIIQTLVDEDKRGRVMSLYVLSFAGISPLGSLLAGTVATLIGVPYTFLLNGIISVIGAMIFAWKLPTWRSAALTLYRNKGITVDG